MANNIANLSSAASSEICQICQENEGNLVPLNCSHLFHEACVGTWVNQRPRCPICRRDITHINQRSVAEFIALPSADALAQAQLAAREREIATRLEISVSQGNLALFQTILRGWTGEGRAVRTEWLGSALETAAMYGRTNLILPILGTEPRVSTRDCGKALIQAATYGHVQIVTLLEANHEIAIEDKSAAMRMAAAENRLGIVRLLISNNPRILHTKDASKAAVQSVRNGNLAMLQILTPAEVEFPIGERSEAVVIAAENDRMDLVEHLLANNAQILPKSRGEAVLEAVYNGNLAMLQILTPAEVEFPIEERSDAVMIAAKKDRLDLMQRLLANGTQIHPNIRSEAVLEAVRNGNLDMLRLLLPEGTKIDSRGQAVNSAAAQGRLDLIQYLLPYGEEIDLYYRSVAIDRVLSSHSQDMLRILQYLFPPDANILQLDDCVNRAVCIQNLEALKILLPPLDQIPEGREPIPSCITNERDLMANFPTAREKVEKARWKGARYAVKTAKPKALRFLLSNIKTVSIKDFQQDLDSDFNQKSDEYWDRIDVIRILLEKGVKISEINLGNLSQKVYDFTQSPPFTTTREQYLNLFRFILLIPSIFTEPLPIEFYKTAIEANDLEVVEGLLQKCGLAESDRNVLVEQAAKKGSIEMVQALLASGPISDESRKRAVQSAEANLYRQVVDVLRPSGSLKRRRSES